jgi:ketosteroid isomerase-like protein
MALLEDRTAVFIVRVWCELGDADSAVTEWRGSVEHMQSGQRVFFRHLESVLEFMKPHLKNIGIDAQQRFWERISSVIDDGAGDTQIEIPLNSGGDTPAPSTAERKRR